MPPPMIPKEAAAAFLEDFLLRNSLFSEIRNQQRVKIKSLFVMTKGKLFTDKNRQTKDCAGSQIINAESEIFLKNHHFDTPIKLRIQARIGVTTIN